MKAILKTPFRTTAVLAVLLAGVFNTAQAAIPIEHWTHASGARVYLVASPSIPMLDVQLDFDGGSRRDPAAQAGLASATAGLLSGGVAAQPGLPALDENQLSEAWVDLGAQFGAQASADRFTLSLRTLTEPDLLQRAVALHEVGAQAPYVLMPVGHALAKRASVALRDLADEPLVLIDLPHSRQYFLSLLAHAGVRPQVVMESGSLEMVRALVAHGHGLSLLTTRPSRDVSYDGRRLVCKPLSGKVPPQRLVLAASASVPLSPAAEAFVQVAREHLAAAG